MSTANQPPAIACPHCQAQLKAPVLAPGTRVKCPTCGQAFTFAEPSAAANPQSPATVDPLMLGPVAQPKPAPVTEIAVVCKLCGTRMYAPESKIGQTMPCPDCHTVNEILRPTVAKKAIGPTLAGAEEFQLSNPGDRPAYRPLVVPRGDYAELAEFDPATHPPGWTPPEPSGVATAAAPPEDELKLSAPTERIDDRPAIVLPPPDPPDKGSLYDGKYDDGLLGDWNVDRKQPDAWKKAPFVLGLLGFLIRPSTLTRILPMAIGLAVVLIMLHLTIASALADSASGMLFAILLSMGTAVLAGLWLMPFSATLVTIVEDTANGQDEVTGWPDFNLYTWFPAALYFPLAGVIAGLPGALLASALVAGGLPAIASPLLVLVSWLVLLPPVIYSMLAEGSPMAVFSQRTMASFRVASEAWLLFYFYSFGIALCLAMADGLASLPYIAAQVAGAAGIVPMVFLYCRVLGRLMWYTSEKEAKGS